MENDLYTGIFLGFILGFCYFVFKFRTQINKIAENLPVQKNLSTLDRPILFTEFYNDIILVYNNKTQNFVCQGHSLDELVKKLSFVKIDKAYLIYNLEHNHEVYSIENNKCVRMK